MAFNGTNFFSAILITTKNPEILYNFYKNILKFPLEEEEHGETIKHYGCEMGDLHFAIHPIENFDDQSVGVGSIKMAFEIFDMNAFVENLRLNNIEPLYPPKEMGPMQITAIKDPDGNYLEFTQLSSRWIDHLKKRKQEGNDIVSKWEELQ